MSFISIASIFTTFCIISALFHEASCHTFLLKPRAYIRGYSPDGCKGEQCKACPIQYKKLMNNTADNPAMTWKRGENVTIRWAKNNHLGGFVRFSIVPVDKIMDVRIHDRLAFYFGCWEQGVHTCSKKQACGADKTRRALRRGITVPRYLPDGIYIFGLLWFGGLHHLGKKSQFADFPSCSYIRIKGGDDIQDSYRPVFKPGEINQYSAKRRRRMDCPTYTDTPRFCTKPHPGCMKYPAFRSIPRVFKNNAQPKKIFYGYFKKGFNLDSLFSNFKKPNNMSSSSTNTNNINTNKEKNDNTEGNTNMKKTNSNNENTNNTQFNTSNVNGTQFNKVSSNNGNQEKNNNSPNTISSNNGNDRICFKGICCPTECGTCNGNKGCSERPGGKDNCCLFQIRKNGRKCSDVSPPCVTF